MNGGESGGERKLSRMAGAHLHGYIPVNVNQVRKITSMNAKPSQDNVTGQYGETGDSAKVAKAKLGNYPVIQVLPEKPSPKNSKDDGLLRKATLNDSTSSEEAFNQSDIGSNLFITYFLHALEMERLISLNKELVDESREMEGEIEGAQTVIIQANKEIGLLKSEVELLRKRPERLPTPPKTFENEARLLSEELSSKQLHIEKLEAANCGMEKQVRDLTAKLQDRSQLCEKSTMTAEHKIPGEENLNFLGVPKPESFLNEFENIDWSKPSEEKFISFRIPEKRSPSTKHSSREQSVQVESPEPGSLERRVAELESLLEQQARIHAYELQSREKEVQRWRVLCDPGLLPGLDRSPNLSPKGSSYDYIPSFKPSHPSACLPGADDLQVFTPASKCVLNRQKEEVKIDGLKETVEESKGGQTRPTHLKTRPSSTGIKPEKNYLNTTTNTSGVKTQLSSILLSPQQFSSHPQRANIRKLYITTHEELKPRYAHQNHQFDLEKRRDSSSITQAKKSPFSNFLKLSKKDKSQGHKSYLLAEGSSASNLKTPLGYSNEQRFNDFAYKGTLLPKY
jgi:hypothetical protein